MQITPKSSELLLAQVADFAQTTRLGLVSEVGTYATMDATGTAVAPDGLTEYLRQGLGNRRKAIQAREQAQYNYPKFEALVDELLANLGDNESYYKDDKKIYKNYVGHGTNSVALGIELDGQQYIVKVPFYRPEAAMKADSYVSGLALGRDTPGLEQLAALSYKRGVLITERLPGKDLSCLDVNEASKHMTKEQFVIALETMQAALDAGIALDPHISNFMYDKGEGFGFVDYSELEDIAYMRNAENPHAIMATQFMLAIYYIGGEYYKAEHRQAVQPILRCYRAALAEYTRQNGKSGYGGVFENIDKRITIG